MYCIYKILSENSNEYYIGSCKLDKLNQTYNNLMYQYKSYLNNKKSTHRQIYNIFSCLDTYYLILEENIKDLETLKERKKYYKYCNI